VLLAQHGVDVWLGMRLTSGTKLDDYEIVGPLGSGGMGEVYRARDTILKREVAIKVLPYSVLQDSERLRRFEQEAQAAASLNHPNIIWRQSLLGTAPAVKVVSLPGKLIAWMKPSPDGKKLGLALGTPSSEAVIIHAPR
jgi:hypothetical protein